MGKRRKGKRNSDHGFERDASITNSRPSGASKSSKFWAFEFAEDERRVEIESCRLLSKFDSKSPIRKSMYDFRANKYAVLERYTNGDTASKNDPGNRTDVTVRAGSRTAASTDFECLSRGKKSNIHGNRRLGRCRPEQNKNFKFYVDSNEDGRTPSKTSCPDLAGNQGSLEEQQSQHGTRRNDSVKPDVVNLQLKFVKANEAEVSVTDPGFKELEFVILDDPQWFRNQEEIKSLDPKYENAWETILSECSFNEPFDEIMYPEGDPDAVFIRMRDVELLQPRTFLNDTIIDFYIKYIVNKMKPVEQQRFHFFNTFFFQKLVDMDRVSFLRWEGSEAFQRVQKWTRNIDLFGKDYIFIPVNFSLHWSLIVVCHPGKIANLRDKDMNDSSKKPCILHMDSIRGSHRGLEDIIRRYLWEEWKARHGVQDVDISSRFSHLLFKSLRLPQQENFFDCGLFLLHYAELFLAQAFSFNTTNSSCFLKEDWFLPAEVSVKKREHIRKLIHGVVEESLLRNPPTEKCHSSALDEGDGSVKILQEKDEKETCDLAKCSSGVNHVMEGQQSFHHFQELVNNHFGNAGSSSEKEAVEKEDICLEGETSCTKEACGDDRPVSPQCPLNSSRAEEMEIPCATSKTCSSGTSQSTNNVKNSEDCVREVSSSSEMVKDKCKCPSTSREEFILECIVEDSEEEVIEIIVEDSEEENETGIIRSRKYPSDC